MMRGHTHQQQCASGTARPESRPLVHGRPLPPCPVHSSMLAAPRQQPLGQHTQCGVWGQPSASRLAQQCRAQAATKEGALEAHSFTHDSLMALKVVELQALLVERHLAKSGKKELLVDRLLTHEQATGHLAKSGTVAADGAQRPLATQPVESPPPVSAAGAAEAVGTGKAPRARTRRSKATSADGAGLAAEDQPTTAQTAAEVAAAAAAAEAAAQAAEWQEALRAAEAAVAAEAAAAEAAGSFNSSAGRLIAASRRAAAQSDADDEAAGLQGVQGILSGRGGQDGVQGSDQDREAREEGRERDSLEGVEPIIVRPEDLPPMPVLKRGRSWAVQERPIMENEELARILQGNPTDLQVAMLGTAADLASRMRALASVALCRGKDVWLFDVGDDTQRQLGVVPHIKPSKIYRVFLTCLAPETLLGLPGMLCTMSSARVRGHEKTDIPIHVYGPEGTAEFLASVFKVSHTYLETNILVVEFAQTPVLEELRQPTLFNRRARIFRAVVPPDQLNPEGCFDGDLAAFMPTQRAVQPRGQKSSAGALSQDARAVFLPFPKLPPGDPDRADALHPSDMKWTIHADSGAQLTAVMMPANKPTFAYVFKEADRAGTLVVERAQALGVPKGKSYSLLKDGLSVVTRDGLEISPDMVCTANKPGRRVVILGSTSHLPPADSAFTRLARGADAWVSGCVRSHPDAQEEQGGLPATGHAAVVVAPQGGQAAVVATQRSLAGKGQPAGLPQGNSGEEGSVVAAAQVQQVSSQAQHQGSPCVDTGDLSRLACELQVEGLLLARFSTIVDGDTPQPGAALGTASEQQAERRILAAVEQGRAAAAQAAAAQGPEAVPPHVVAACDFWVQVFEKHDGPGKHDDDGVGEANP